MALLLVGMAAGCRDEPRPARADDGRIAVTLDDFLIRPQAVRAEAGRITITAVNRGRIGHNVHVREGRRDLLEVDTLLPGGRGTGTAEIPRGDYKLLCTVGNHEELGMYGTLTVR
jgi:plastocyanin